MQAQRYGPLGFHYPSLHVCKVCTPFKWDANSVPRPSPHAVGHSLCSSLPSVSALARPFLQSRGGWWSGSSPASCTVGAGLGVTLGTSPARLAHVPLGPLCTHSKSSVSTCCTGRYSKEVKAACVTWEQAPASREGEQSV